jgi:hypothetical protein
MSVSMKKSEIDGVSVVDLAGRHCAGGREQFGPREIEDPRLRR